MEFMAGGSLYDIIKEYEKFKLKEEHIAYVLKEVMAQNSLLAEAYHANGIVIRRAAAWPTSTA
jgi:serine/threonine protein kinase